MGRIWPWLKENADPLGAVGSIVTAAGLIGTIVAIVFAWLSLRDTKRAVEANLMYQLQSDAREISNEIFGDQQVREYILARKSGEGVGREAEAKATGMMHKLIRFYASIERLNSYEYVEDEYWKNTKEDICDLMVFPNFRTFWEENVAAEGAQFRPSFKALGDNCGNS